MSLAISIRAERSEDFDRVRVVNERAFGAPAEAALVDALRSVGGAISLVAAIDGGVAGHILFTPVEIGSDNGAPAMGLAPMAVVPEYQRQGIGSALVRAGLDACRAQDQHIVVVLGHPEFYPRFGFVPASTKGLSCEYPVPPEVFMVAELFPGALDGRQGLVRYRPEFASVEP